MPELRYNIQNTISDLPLSPSEVVSRYFFGIELVDQSGNILAEDTIRFYIEAAIAEFEGFLNLKLTKQLYEERLDYNLSDWKHWGFLPLSFPAISIHSLIGFIGDVEQVVYPTEWLRVKTASGDDFYHRAVYLVPTTGAAEHNSVVYSGLLPHVGWLGQDTIPNYWNIKYCTSFKKVPKDIIDAIGKLASLNIFNQLGDIILGAGIASQSIGIDGLSQSISTTSSATNAGYGARITQYIAELKLAVPKLKAKYDGMVLMSM